MTTEPKPPSIHRPLILGKPEPMPDELLRHVVASLANRDVLNLSAEMGRRLLADRDFQAQRAEHFPTIAGAMAEMASGLQRVAVAAGWPADQPVEDSCELAESVAELRQQAEIGRKWHEDSSLEQWFPLTAKRLSEVESCLKEARSLLEVMDGRLVDRQRERDEARVEAARLRAELDRKSLALLSTEQQLRWARDDGAKVREGLDASRVETEEIRSALNTQRKLTDAAQAEVARLRSRVAEALGLDHATAWDELIESIPIMLVEERQRGFTDGEAEAEARTDAEDQRVADDLLAARAGWRKAEAEVQRLRSRVRVEAEDVVHRKITDGRAKRYLLAQGFTLGHRYRGGGPDRDPLDLVQLEWGNEAIVALADLDDDACSGDSIAFVVCWLARKDSRSSWDILDEMTRMEVSK